MRRPGGRGRADDDRGSALVEFIVIGITLLVPVGYLALTIAHLQSAAFATSLAAREAGRAFAASSNVPEARTAATDAARLAFRDHGLELPQGALAVTCGGAPCLQPGSVVRTRVSWRVLLPWLPAVDVGLESEHVEPIDDFRSDLL